MEGIGLEGTRHVGTGYGEAAPTEMWPEEAAHVRHILLIDDVFTTGSTLAACHAALRTAFGPEVRISVATLAFTG